MFSLFTKPCKTLTVFTLLFTLVALFPCLSGTAAAQTVTVTTAADTIDIDWQTATIADLPGPDGKVSFSEALIATNHTSGHQTIGFAIPQNEWILQFILPGRAVLTALTGYFWYANDEVTIDGTTQTAFTGDTNPDGNEVALYGNGLGLNADNCTLIGFDSSNISWSGSNGLIEGNTGSMNIDLFGGSGSLIKDNQGGTIKIDRSSDNVVVGNVVNRVRVLGWTPLASNNRIGGPNPEDRNIIWGYGTHNSEGLPSGAAVQLFYTDGTVVENNWIGTADGLTIGNLACTVGVGLETQNDNVLIKDNLISGIYGLGMGPHHAGQLFGRGILASGTGSDLTITGNVIGPDLNGDPLLGAVWGLDLGYPVTHPLTMTDIAISDNEIAGHIFNGVTVGSKTPNVRLSGNSIHDNGWLGIDLIPTSYGYGVTPNDRLDEDTGGNGLQNFPELHAALREGSAMRVLGMLQSTPSSNFTVEFFASPECDASGFGEGQMFIGAETVTTDLSGDADFNVLLNQAVPDGWFITSTATLEPLGATSEFSACIGTPWRDEGSALAGTHGAPSLYGTGTLAANEAVTLNLENALENTAAFLVVGTTAVNLPFYGGTLVPAFLPPSGFYMPKTTNNNGSVLIEGSWPAGMPSGTTTYFQYWIVDPSGPYGFSASNALSGTTP